MSNLYEEEFSMDEKNPFTNVLRIDSELFKEEDFKIPEKIIQVKRINKIKNGKEVEVWEVYDDKKMVLKLEGYRFTSKEKKFLRTSDGFIYIVEGYKKGWRTVSKFKQNLEV